MATTYADTTQCKAVKNLAKKAATTLKLNQKIKAVVVGKIKKTKECVKKSKIFNGLLSKKTNESGTQTKSNVARKMKKSVEEKKEAETILSKEGNKNVEKSPDTTQKEIKQNVVANKTKSIIQYQPRKKSNALKLIDEVMLMSSAKSTNLPSKKFKLSKEQLALLIQK